MKKIHIGDEARSLLKEGVTEFVAAVKSTLGPAGNNVMIHSRNFISGYTVTKDGVTVANEIRFSDPVKDMAALTVRQASRNTAKSAGDGTTTSAVFAEALINAFDDYLPASGLTRVQFAREIKKVLDAVKENVVRMSKDMTPELVRSVSMISSNGDTVVSDCLAEAFKNTDVIDVIESDEDTDVVFKMVNGITLERGWAHEFFINNERSRTTVFEKPLVLVYDGRIKNFEPMEVLIRDVVNSKRPLVLIAHLEKQALETLLFNVSKGTIRAVAIEPPLNGHRRLQLMKHVCQAIGATYFSDQTGDDLGMIKFSDLGEVEEITVTSDDTILKPSEKQLESIAGIVEDMKNNPDIPEDEKQEFLRLASGGYGQIKVGGSSQAERKERKDRVDDAVCAIRSARRKGVVPGGGTALINSCHFVTDELLNSCAYRVATIACESPLRQMLTNFGLKEEDIEERVISVIASDGNAGWNLYNMEWCDSMFDAGIVDPTEVTLNVIDNGFSIASMISTTNTVITDEKSSQ
mgnify:CR=1 FL=1